MAQAKTAIKICLNICNWNAFSNQIPRFLNGILLFFQIPWLFLAWKTFSAISIFSRLIYKKANDHMDCVKQIWYLSPMQAVKVQASLRIRAVSPEPSLLAHTSSESRGTFRQKARSLAPLNAWECAVKICHDGMLEDTNSLDGAHILFTKWMFSEAVEHVYFNLIKIKS